MKLIKALLLLLITLQFVLICYANRALYTSTFDANYWRDKYDHSQWKLLYSNRPIGDDGLYLYEGYRLVHGGDPTTFNAETPPLGKYLIGICISLFGNGYLFGLIVTSLAILACYWLCITATGNTVLSLTITSLILSDPLIVEQFRLTMLDSLQLLFFVCFVTALTIALKNKKLLYGCIIAAGVSLGFFAATKFPMLAPVFAFGGAFFLWKHTKQWKSLVIFFLSACFAYLVPYIPYFTMHHTFPQWLLVQKFMVSFYLHSKLPAAYGSIFTTLLFNQNQNLFTHAYEYVSQWSPMWPLITICTIVAIITLLQDLRSQKIDYLYIPTFGSVLLLLLFYAIIPFWTRYLVVILPLLYVGFGIMVRRMHHMLQLCIFVLCISVNLVASTFILMPSPASTINQFTSDWKQGLFQDMYEALTQTSKRSMSRAEFYKTGKQFFYDAEIEDIALTTTTPTWHITDAALLVPTSITYKTRYLGPVTVSTKIPIVKERGLWKIDWKWNLLFPDLQSDYHLQTLVDTAKRGSIYTKAGFLLAEDKMSTMIWLAPHEIFPDTEDDLFHALEEVFRKQIIAVGIHERYVRMGDLGNLVPVGVIMHPIDPVTERIVKSYPAIKTTPAYGRMTNVLLGYNPGTVQNTLYNECCSLLYTTQSYDGTTGLEKQYNQVLKGQNGGSLVIQNQAGAIVKTLIDKKRIDGNDVKLDK